MASAPDAASSVEAAMPLAPDAAPPTEAAMPLAPDAAPPTEAAMPLAPDAAPPPDSAADAPRTPRTNVQAVPLNVGSAESSPSPFVLRDIFSPRGEGATAASYFEDSDRQSQDVVPSSQSQDVVPPLDASGRTTPFGTSRSSRIAAAQGETPLSTPPHSLPPSAPSSMPATPPGSAGSLRPKSGSRLRRSPGMASSPPGSADRLIMDSGSPQSMDDLDEAKEAVEDIPMTRQKRVLVAAAAVEIDEQDISDVEDA